LRGLFALKIVTSTDATAGQPKEVHEQVAAITPLRRLGMPDDIAGVILLLQSSPKIRRLAPRTSLYFSASESFPCHLMAE
jgi:NAD(P)-dependent dehydrogenase (short-subunit alcohol dehydrogenase family)